MDWTPIIVAAIVAASNLLVMRLTEKSATSREDRARVEAKRAAREEGRRAFYVRWLNMTDGLGEAFVEYVTSGDQNKFQSAIGADLRELFVEAEVSLPSEVVPHLDAHRKAIGDNLKPAINEAFKINAGTPEGRNVPVLFQALLTQKTETERKALRVAIRKDLGIG